MQFLSLIISLPFLIFFPFSFLLLITIFSFFIIFYLPSVTFYKFIVFFFLYTYIVYGRVNQPAVNVYGIPCMHFRVQQQRERNQKKMNRINNNFMNMKRKVGRPVFKDFGIFIKMKLLNALHKKGEDRVSLAADIMISSLLQESSDGFANDICPYDSKIINKIP